MSARAAFIRWAVIGAVASAILLWAQSEAVGGVDGLLQVGETSDVRPLIESQLGEVPLAAGPGHDGQIYYAIGLDLTGDEVGPLLDHAAYRYRRILYPLFSSGFGVLDGTALLVGMIVVTVASTAVASGATAALGARLGIGEWAALAVLLNPGVWLSVRLLTSDMLALALMMVGLMTLGARLAWPAVNFALSTLAKDVFVVTPIGLAVSRDRKRWVIGGISVLVLLAWMTWLTLTLGDGFTGRGNLAWPFMGLVDATSNWPTLDPEELTYLVFGLVTVLAGLIVGITRSNWMRWPILGWTALALISSNWVWDFGNNAARAFAPLAVLVVLSFGRDPTQATAATGEPSDSALV